MSPLKLSTLKSSGTAVAATLAGSTGSVIGNPLGRKYHLYILKGHNRSNIAEHDRLTQLWGLRWPKRALDGDQIY